MRSSLDVVLANHVFFSKNRYAYHRTFFTFSAQTYETPKLWTLLQRVYGQTRQMAGIKAENIF